MARVVNSEKLRKRAMFFVHIGTLLWLVGFVMILLSLVFEFGSDKLDLGGIGSDEERALDTLKTGSLAFIFSGVFLALVGIARLTGLIPLKIGEILYLYTSYLSGGAHHAAQTHVKK